MSVIVCCEGLDGGGKSTQAKILTERLGATLFSFPDHVRPAGKAVRANMGGEWNISDKTLEKRLISTEALVRQSLMLTNRMEYGEDMKDAARRGPLVFDRYDASAIVYGSLDGLDMEWLKLTNAQLPIRPDLYLLLDIPVAESWKRRPERRDMYERDPAYLERVRVAYLKLFTEEQEAYKRGLSWDQVERLAAGNRHAYRARWRVIDGTGSVEQVAERIWSQVVEAGG